MSQKVSFTPALIDRIGPIGRVLEDFLSQQVRAVQAVLEKKWPGISHSAAKRVLNGFVSLEGTKKPQSAQEFQALGVNESQKLFILQQLEKSRILTESDGIYEVAHDTLAKIIAEQRTDDEVALLEAVKLIKDRRQDYQKYNTLLSRKELAFLGRYEARLREYEQLAPEEWAFVRKSKRAATLNRGFLIVALAALVAASLGFTYYIIEQKNFAQKQAKKEEGLKKDAEIEKMKAQLQQVIAESEKAKAEEQKRIAESERVNAQLQQGIAESEKAKAEEQKRIAEQQTEEAQRLKGIAESEKAKAEEQKRIAESERVEAVKQREKAQELKEIAEQESLKSRYFILSNQSSIAQNDDNTLAVQLAYAAYETAIEAEEKNITLYKEDKEGRAREDAWNLFMDMAAQQHSPFYRVRIDLDNEVSSLDSLQNGDLLIEKENGELLTWTTDEELKKGLQVDNTSKIATISEDKYEVYYGARDGKKQKLPLSDPKDSAEINAIALSNDSKFLLVNTDDSFIKYEFATKKPEPLNVKGSKAASCIAFLPKGKHFLYAYEDKKNDCRIKIQSLENRKQFFNWSNPPKGHSDRITALSVSPNGEYLVSGSRDKTAILWSIDAGNPSLDNLHTLEGHNYKVNAVAFSPDGRYIVTGSDDKTIMLWNLDGEMIQTFKGHSQEVTTLQWLNEHSFASGSLDKTVKIWDITHLYRKMDHTKEGTLGGVLQSRFYGKNQAIPITATRSGKIYRWDFSNGQAAPTLLGKMPRERYKEITDFFLGPGKDLVLCNRQGYIGRALLREDTIVELKEEETEEETYQTPGGGRFLPLLPFSPDKKSFLLVGLNEPMVQQYTFQGDSIAETWVFPVDTPAMTMTAAYFPQSPKVVTADNKGTVYIWNTSDGGLVDKWKNTNNKGILSIAVSPDESCLATGGRDSKLVLWDAEGNEIQSIDDHKGAIQSIAFSKDGTMLLTGSWDNLARLYRLIAGKWQLVQRFEGHTNIVYSVSFSPDERQVLTACNDKTARIWNIIDMESDMIAPLTASQKRLYGLKD